MGTCVCCLQDEGRPVYAFLLEQWDKTVQAITKIQRAFRKWRAQCQRVGWPSDENPWHWKHWIEFRQQYGW